MPKRKDETNKTESIQLRLTPETRRRCTEARLSGAHKLEAEASFMGFLVELGIAKYEKAILPMERGDDEIQVSATEKREVS